MREFELSLSGLDILFYSVPASLILLLTREWFVGTVVEKMGFVSHAGSEERVNPFLRFDLWAFAMLSYWGVAWGGTIQKNRDNNLISFILYQLWFVVIFTVVFLFLKFKQYENVGFTYYMLKEMLRQAWTLHLLNYIPLPPFDGSFFYMRYIDSPLIVAATKAIATVLIMFGLFGSDFITGVSILDRLGV